MPVGMNDPRQTIGLADTVSSPQQTVDWSQPYSWGGANWTATTPSQQQQAFDWANTNGVNPMARDTLDYTQSAFNSWAGANQDWLQKQGYNGSMPGGGVAINQDMTTPVNTGGDLENWLNQNGYKFGTAQYNHTIAGNVFDKYGNPVGNGPAAGSRTGYDWGWTVPVAMFAGGAALAAGGGGGAGAGETLGSTVGGGGSVGGAGVPGFAQGTLGAAEVNSPLTQQLVAAGAGGDMGVGAAATPADFFMGGAGGTAGIPTGAAGAAGGSSGLMSGAADLWNKYSGLFGGAKGIGNVVGSLANAYSQNQNMKSLQGMMDQAKVGPDSPYAKQLREELMRKDAAAGRRSDYGSREVQLQAKLAELNSRNLPSLISAQQNYNKSNSGMLNSLINAGQQVNWGDLAKTVGGWFGG